jgi:hypothetical protein
MFGIHRDWLQPKPVRVVVGPTSAVPSQLGGQVRTTVGLPGGKAATNVRWRGDDRAERRYCTSSITAWRPTISTVSPGPRVRMAFASGET